MCNVCIPKLGCLMGAGKLAVFRCVSLAVAMCVLYPMFVYVSVLLTLQWIIFDQTLDGNRKEASLL